MSRELLQKYQIRAKKSLGQNFLVDEMILQKIAESTEITGKNILEVGPGYGALTEKILLQHPNALHLVELDRDMVEILLERFGSQQSPDSYESGLDVDIKIFHQDVLTFFPDFGEESYSVVANIPYYITSPILRHFLYEVEKGPENMLILMQKDVADKILGGKKKKSSVLSLFIEKKCFVSEKIFVPKESFIPAPKVESSVLHFETHQNFNHIDDTKFFELIKAGFSEPRKKCIKNLLKAGYDGQKISEFLTQKGRDENFRGEDGDMEFWGELYLYLNS